jgi:hypothetical protein
MRDVDLGLSVDIQPLPEDPVDGRRDWTRTFRGLILFANTQVDAIDGLGSYLSTILSPKPVRRTMRGLV